MNYPKKVNASCLPIYHDFVENGLFQRQIKFTKAPSHMEEVLCNLRNCCIATKRFPRPKMSAIIQMGKHMEASSTKSLNKR